jgi:hypothetical protein
MMYFNSYGDENIDLKRNLKIKHIYFFTVIYLSWVKKRGQKYWGCMPYFNIRERKFFPEGLGGLEARDDDVSSDKLQTTGVTKSIVYMWNVEYSQ